MTWIKLDDQAVDHPKVANLSDRAFRWWVRGLSYASRFLTNGYLPAVFVRQVPKTSQDELTTPNLWTPTDRGSMEIHDYLAHQSSKESVTKKRAVTAERVKRYREAKGNAVTNGVTNGVSNELVRAPENREQRTEVQRTERRAETAAPLITNSLQFEKRRTQCAFVGARLEVPNHLHAELRTLLGGSNPDKGLMDWYAAVDEEIEQSGERITPDIFKWLKARYGAWSKDDGMDAGERAVAALNAHLASKHAKGIQ